MWDLLSLGMDCTIQLTQTNLGFMSSQEKRVEFFSAGLTWAQCLSTLKSVGFTFQLNSLAWKCKLCSASLSFSQYSLVCSHYSRISPIPCLFDSCICTLQPFNALKAH